MAENTPPRQAKPSWPGASLALFILGLCILVPAGLCTGTAIVIYPPAVLVFLMLGGVPMAIGAALVWGALRARDAAAKTVPGPVPAQPAPLPDKKMNVALLLIGLLILVPAGLFTVSAFVSIATGVVEDSVLLQFVLFVVPALGLMAFGAWLIRAAQPRRRG